MNKPSASILVVEDDPAVSEVIVDTLRDAGLDVRATVSGWTALRMIRRRSFDLLVADIGLPDGLDGFELVQCARLTRPTLKCLFISGGGQMVMDDPERDDFVGKPFRHRELLGCVWELLQRRLPQTTPESDIRQATRSLLAAKVDCRRRQLLEQRRAARRWQVR
jgi:two-component system, OmpR family, response regulator